MRSLDRRKTWCIVALLVLAGGHAASYRVPNILNDHGRAGPEWPLLFGSAVVPSAAKDLWHTFEDNWH
ncbi:hypothetical protein E7V67_007685 [[Empedobacter] haloabium]|uniref:Uncharacterized protein n=1 Tax=[Empedobacter] haloabium TaxID=592317 RepID=A0ABZ1UQH9_9BURK